jgi:hypothetical protein
LLDLDKFNVLRCSDKFLLVEEARREKMHIDNDFVYLFQVLVFVDILYVRSNYWVKMLVDSLCDDEIVIEGKNHFLCAFYVDS